MNVLFSNPASHPGLHISSNDCFLGFLLAVIMLCLDRVSTLLRHLIPSPPASVSWGVRDDKCAALGQLVSDGLNYFAILVRCFYTKSLNRNFSMVNLDYVFSENSPTVLSCRGYFGLTYLSWGSVSVSPFPHCVPFLPTAAPPFISLFGYLFRWLQTWVHCCSLCILRCNPVWLYILHIVPGLPTMSSVS